jgi:hypothetical protein
MATEPIPDFRGVWASGLEAPEPMVSREEAVERAYSLARSNAGATVHLVRWSSEGTIKYPPVPTATGMLAQYQPRCTRDE